MRAPIAILAGAVTILAVAGCGASSSRTPAACLDGTGAYLAALGNAPGEVKLSDGVPIGDCLTKNQQAGDLATVGGTMVVAATKLNAAARADPGGGANLQLGYLLGAARRGAEHTGGVDAELIRRLTAAARYSPAGRPLPPRFTRTYGRGFDAGHSAG